MSHVCLLHMEVLGVKSILILLDALHLHILIDVFNDPLLLCESQIVLLIPSLFATTQLFVVGSGASILKRQNLFNDWHCRYR